MRELCDWYRVRFDDRAVYRDVEPPDRERWSDEFVWTDVTRICFRAGDFLESDELYVFTTRRPESYLIPTEAGGFGDLIAEIVRRGLFSPELLIEATQSANRIACLPAIESGEGGAT